MKNKAFIGTARSRAVVMMQNGDDGAKGVASSRPAGEIAAYAHG